MNIRAVDDKLHLIPLNLPKEGFHHFLCAWLYRNGRTAILIDPGPRSTIPALLKALADMEVGHIDHVLLTHIHLDHAGGLGLLLERYPEAKTVCHSKGVPHLLKPEKLWNISQKVLLDVASLYGEPAPVAGGGIMQPCNDITGIPDIEIYETPGHAPHHLSFRVGDTLFAGEAAGVIYPLEGDTYLRIAAPPGFDLDDYRRSLDVLMHVEARTICYGHFGMSFEVRKCLDLARAQTELWVSVIEGFKALESPLFEEKVFDALLARDSGLARFDRLPGDIKKREIFFLGNSFKGFRMALKRK